MKSRLDSQLDKLQQDLSLFENLSESLSDVDSESLASNSTEATSVRSHENKPLKPLPFHHKAAAVQNGLDGSTLILECLDDMILQENTLIESALMEVHNCLAESIPMNSYYIPSKSLYPFSTS